MSLFQTKSVDEKETHRLFSIHGLHPQLPVSLWESLESDGHISTETATDTIQVLQLNDSVSMYNSVPFSVQLVWTFTHKNKKLGKQNKRES